MCSSAAGSALPPCAIAKGIASDGMSLGCGSSSSVRMPDCCKCVLKLSPGHGSSVRMPEPWSCVLKPSPGDQVMKARRGPRSGVAEWLVQVHLCGLIVVCVCVCTVVFRPSTGVVAPSRCLCWLLPLVLNGIGLKEVRSQVPANGGKFR